MAGSDQPSPAERMLLDGASAGFVVVLIGAACAYPGTVPEWKETAAGLTLAGGAYLLGSLVARRFARGFASIAISTASVLLLFSYLFQTIAGFQHILVPGWMDSRLISWESALTGTEASVLMQKITTPALTEWMMFAYVFYVPLLPGVAFLCYAESGSKGAHDYLIAIVLANVICYCGFILFPVAGPLFHDASRYTVPLGGGVFAWCGEWMRSNVHYPGGSLPSPHCAVGTVMMVMLYRHNRKAFAILLAPLVTIYAATMYGRYHYAWDVIAGIGAACIALKAAPALAGLFAQPARTLSGTYTIRHTPETAATRLQEERP